MLFSVTVKDFYGQSVSVEVTQDIYDLFEEERKADHAYIKSYFRNIEYRELDDSLLSKQTSCLSHTTEEIYFAQEKLNQIKEVINSCTNIQIERFLLYICGYAYDDIAKLQSCRLYAVQKSVKAVLKKFENIDKHGW